MGSALLALGASLAVQFPTVAAATGSHPTSVLAPLDNPSLAFGLLLVALLGVGIEILHPGSFVPGSIGIAAGVLAVAGLANLPVNVFGLVLVAAAAALMVIDTAGQSHGLLSVLGVGLAVAAGLLLFRGAAGQGVNLAVVVAVPGAVGATWFVLSRRALQVRHIPWGASTHELLGLIATVRERADPYGIAAVGGELWRVTDRHGAPLEVGTEVEVIARDGLTLIVTPPGGLPPVSAAGPASGDVPGPVATKEDQGWTL